MVTQTKTQSWILGDTAAPLPPKVPGMPIMGNALAIGKDPMKFSVDNYHKFGPIYRAQIPGREITFMAGIDVNNLVKQADEILFTNELAFGWANEQLGPIMTAQSNEEHAHMRKLLRPAYSRVQVAKQIPTMVQVVDAFMDELEIGQSFEVFSTMQRLVVTQLGYVMLNYPPGEYLPDFRTFMKTILQVDQFKTRPSWFYKLPFYKRAKSRAFEMANKVVAYLEQTEPGVDRPRTGLDILRDETDLQGQPYTRAHLLAEVMAPYLAGQDTVAGTLAFLGYTTHKYPDVHERVSREAREQFSPELGLGDLRKLDAIHKTIVETMRMYPIGGIMPRHAQETFSFNGYRVDAGSYVYTMTGVVHFLPEYYEDPYSFNIDRPAGPSGTFVPYGVGNYACLGAGIADIQLLVTLAALLRRGRFELDPPNYDIQLTTMPVPNPGSYSLKLVEKYPTV